MLYYLKSPPEAKFAGKSKTTVFVNSDSDTLVIAANFRCADAPSPRSGITVNIDTLVIAVNFKGADAPTPRGVGSL